MNFEVKQQILQKIKGKKLRKEPATQADKKKQSQQKTRRKQQRKRLETRQKLLMQLARTLNQQIAGKELPMKKPKSFSRQMPHSMKICP